jgi:hypothetical protein
VSIQIFWFILHYLGLVSRYGAIGLLLVTCGLALWLLPYFSPTTLRQRSKPGHYDEG